ncbi:MAG TPA: hypothetical protein VG603_06035 [Chitinophagales bacterium]|nr:hypothetical protein [Chitinophagales bacterium]
MSQLLIHIGFVKSGSTYLQQWFEKHPEIYFQPKFMAQGFLNAWELAKFAQYAPAVPDKYVLSCEDFSLWHSQPHIYGLKGAVPYNHRQFQERICNMLHGLFPNGSILIVTRGYASVFSSIYNQYLGMGGSCTFAEMADLNREMFLEMLDYSYVVDLYRKKFGSDKVILLPYELMRDDLYKFLSIIEKALDIQQHFTLDGGRVNASYDKKILAAYLKTSRLVYNVLKPFPEKWQKYMYLKYTKAVRGKKPNRTIKWFAQFVKGEIDMNGMDELIQQMKGKADILKLEPLFAPYLKDYLL